MPSVTPKRVKDGQKELRKIMRQFKGRAKVRVGFPSSTDDEILNKAIWNEFGTEAKDGGVHIPERPFLRNALRDDDGEIRAAMRKIARKMHAGKITRKQALLQVGEVVKGKVQESITGLKDPANAQVTVDRKGSANPLIDTSEMRGAVTYEVK